MDARNGIGGSLTGLDLRAEIDRLRKERNAVILAHYYQKPEIQDLADFVGDSLDLSRKAEATDADVIAFCGVRFMAETAKILSPDKIVVLPDMNAGCSLEDSCPPEQFAAFRAQHPDHIALTGDLVNISLPDEFARASTWLEGLGTPEQVTVIPGNHDVYVATLWREGLGRWGAYMAGDGQPPATDFGVFPTVRRRGPVALVGLNS
eukprot:gene7278-9270_t